MASASLAVIAAANALTALVFGAVAVHLARRHVDLASRPAVVAIATWWGCMSVLVGLQALELLVGLLGWLSIPFFTAVRYANAMLLAAGACCLCLHVLYLRTGRLVAARVLIPYFLLVGIAYLASIVYHPIVELRPVVFEVTAVRDPPLDGTLLWRVVVAAIGLPLIVAASSYLALVRRLDGPEQKRRALLSSLGILSWVGGGLVAQAVGGEWADFATYTVLGLASGVLVFRAYFQPRAPPSQSAPTRA